MKDSIVMKKKLYEKFVGKVRQKYPKKSFGYFLASKGCDNPMDFYIFGEDVRNDMKEEFEKYGEYYKIHEDAGFLASDEELVKFHKDLRNNGLHVVGVFHSHQRHPAIFSKVDIDLHPSEDLWHLIISVRTFDSPQVKLFRHKNKVVQELRLILED